MEPTNDLPSPSSPQSIPIQSNGVKKQNNYAIVIILTLIFLLFSFIFQIAISGIMPLLFLGIIVFLLKSPSTQPNEAEKPPNYTKNNIIATIFFVYLLIIFFFVFILPRRTIQSESIGGIIFLSAIPMGLLAGVSFLTRMIKLTNKTPVIRILGFFVGLGGGVFILLLSLIAGLFGGLSTSPPIRGT